MGVYLVSQIRYYVSPHNSDDKCYNVKWHYDPIIQVHVCSIL